MIDQKYINNTKKTKQTKGTLYLESLIAITLLSMILMSVFPLFIKSLETTKNLEKKTNLSALTKYIGNYIFRWAQFNPTTKPKALKDYKTGESLEPSGETRINKLLWADPITSTLANITDEYKTNMTIYNKDRVGSALIKVEVWYDENDDNIINSNEHVFRFATIVTEKKKYETD